MVVSREEILDAACNPSAGCVDEQCFESDRTTLPQLTDTSGYRTKRGAPTGTSIPTDMSAVGHLNFLEPITSIGSSDILVRSLPKLELGTESVVFAQEPAKEVGSVGYRIREGSRVSGRAEQWSGHMASTYKQRSATLGVMTGSIRAPLKLKLPKEANRGFPSNRNGRVHSQIGFSPKIPVQPEPRPIPQRAVGVHLGSRFRNRSVDFCRPAKTERIPSREKAAVYIFVAH